MHRLSSIWIQHPEGFAVSLPGTKILRVRILKPIWQIMIAYGCQISLMVWDISAISCKMQHWCRQPTVLISYSHDQKPNREEGALICLFKSRNQKIDAIHPPSTGRAVPVIQAAASDAKNTAALPMSDGKPRRGSGVFTRQSSMSCGVR